MLYWWLPRTWQVWLVARKVRRGNRRVRRYRSWRLSRTPPFVRLCVGCRLVPMCIGPYLLTSDDGEIFVGLGLGPLFVEVVWYEGETRLAKLLWDL